MEEALTSLAPYTSEGSTLSGSSLDPFKSPTPIPSGALNANQTLANQEPKSLYYEEMKEMGRYLSHWNETLSCMRASLQPQGLPSFQQALEPGSSVDDLLFRASSLLQTYPEALWKARVMEVESSLSQARLKSLKRKTPDEYIPTQKDLEALESRIKLKREKRAEDTRALGSKYVEYARTHLLHGLREASLTQASSQLQDQLTQYRQVRWMRRLGSTG